MFSTYLEQGAIAYIPIKTCIFAYIPKTCLIDIVHHALKTCILGIYASFWVLMGIYAILPWNKQTNKRWKQIKSIQPQTQNWASLCIYDLEHGAIFSRVF